MIEEINLSDKQRHENKEIMERNQYIVSSFLEPVLSFCTDSIKHLVDEKTCDLFDEFKLNWQRYFNNSVEICSDESKKCDKHALTFKVCEYFDKINNIKLFTDRYLIFNTLDLLDTKLSRENVADHIFYMVLGTTYKNLKLMLLGEIRKNLDEYLDNEINFTYKETYGKRLIKNN